MYRSPQTLKLIESLVTTSSPHIIESLLKDIITSLEGSESDVAEEIRRIATSTEGRTQGRLTAEELIQILKESQDV